VEVTQMRKAKELEAIKFYTIDLRRTDGEGEFKCPRCGVLISPDDETEDTFTILEPVMKGDALHEISILCNRCKSQIHLVGFDLLNALQR
jgi:hypothetical protein